MLEHIDLYSISPTTEQQWKDLLDAVQNLYHGIQTRRLVSIKFSAALIEIPELRDEVAFWLLDDDDAHCAGI